MSLTRILRLFLILPVLFVAACATVVPDEARDTDTGIVELTRAFIALGPDVDPEEAARAARITYIYTAQLAREYEITDPPLVHNTKVNTGLRPRGLCYHWADDIQARLAQENFQTLELHRAIANADNAFRIEHSTTILGQRGDVWSQGIVLDPWRYGGVLYWGVAADDPSYDWVERSEVFAFKRARNTAQTRRVAIAQ